jgi:hypothetical protein
MAKEDLTPFPKGVSGNPNGRPKGSRNRSTIIKELLELDDNELKIHLAQIKKAIEGDTGSYKAILDSAYGMPTQQTNIDANIKGDDVTPISFVTTKKNNDKDK